MKVLIVKLSALGDVVQSLPVAMAIKRQRPEAKIDWLVERPSAPLLAGHPALERVLVSPRHAIADDFGKVFSSLGSFGRELRKEEYDLVLDLQGLMKSAIFVAAARAQRKIGFAGGKEPAAAWALSERLPPFDPDRHALERYLDLLEPAGLMRPARPDFGLAPGQAAREAAATLAAEPAGEGPLVVLHPMAKWESKLWPRAHWATLARELAGMGCRLLLTGSGADAEATAVIAEAAGLGPALVDAAGRTDLLELAALFALADAVVATDTGAMHLAAAMGARLVALFGPTAPWRTGPFGQGHRVLRLDLDCSPCFQRHCEDPRCLLRLEPAQAARAVRELIMPGGPAPEVEA